MSNKLLSKIKNRVISEANDYGVEVEITNYKNVNVRDGGGSSLGIFIPPEKGRKGRIRVAAGALSSLELCLTLVHEYIHMRQYFNFEPIYFTSDYYKLEKNTELRAISFIKRNGASKKTIDKISKISKKYLQEIK